MFKIRLAGWLMMFAMVSEAATLQEDFSNNPAAHGWKKSGDPALFQWNATDQNVRITWDSSRANSYYYLPLGTVLAREADFRLAFDVRLKDFAAWGGAQKPNPL